MYADPEILGIVTNVYTTHHLLDPDWTPQQCQDFLEGQTKKIALLIVNLAADMAEGSIRAWIDKNGEHPDMQTTIGLRNNAFNQAYEIVIAQEVLELRPGPDDPYWEESLDEDEEEDSPPPLLDRSQIPWDVRWTMPDYRPEPTEDQERLAARVWPTYSILFQITARDLIAVRAEEHMPLPTGPHDPLTAELTTMVQERLRSRDLTPCVGHAQSQDVLGGSEMIQRDGKEKLSRRVQA